MCLAISLCGGGCKDSNINTIGWTCNVCNINKMVSIFKNIINITNITESFHYMVILMNNFLFQNKYFILACMRCGLPFLYNSYVIQNRVKKCNSQLLFFFFFALEGNYI